MTHFRFGSAAKPAKWRTCKANNDFIAKEILALRLMWHVVQCRKEAYDSLQRSPCRQCWTACTEEFLTELRQHTKGCFADYSVKITLDAVLLSQPALEKVVSWWPMQCPAYQNELPKLYPKCAKTQSDLFLARCHFHQRLKTSFPKYHLKDSLAQLCWMERGVS